MPRRFYVTTPIYYINDVPHLGSAYTTIAADVIARYRRIRGFETRFLTGTDEHGIKVQRVAEERGIAPPAYALELSEIFRTTWPKLGCAPDDFIRTGEERHARGAQDIWRRIDERGDIYLGHYEGLYCVGCEAYYTEKDLEQPGNVCPLHKKPVETVKEESYFFRLSKYGPKLLELYRDNPTFVEPASRLNEVKSFVEAGLLDLSISRTTFSWGVPVPNDPRHIMYVWFDALANYYSSLFAPEDKSGFWPCDVHLIGKDILRFHAVYWPAFLLAAGLPPPKQVFAHGFLTYGGQKMSKSLRNTVSPVDLAHAISPEVGVDVVRYTLMRAISFGHDGDFSIQDLLTRYQSELGNALGNLLNRVLPFASEVPVKGPSTPLEEKLAAAHKSGAALAAAAFDETNPTRALDAIWTIVAAANDYVDKSAPWAAKKNDPVRLGTIVATLVEVLDAVSVLIAPVMPVVSAKMREQLGLGPVSPVIDRDAWPFELSARAPGGALQKGAPIFPRFEKEKEAELIKRFSPPEAPKMPAPADAVASETAESKPAEASPPIAFDDFTKLDLRVGLVVSAERVKKKDKLLNLRVDTGDTEPRRIVAGIAAAYAPEELVGKRVVVLTNLPPRSFGKDLVSEGMLLVAESEGTLRVLSVDGEARPGSPVH